MLLILSSCASEKACHFVSRLCEGRTSCDHPSSDFLDNHIPHNTREPSNHRQSLHLFLRYQFLEPLLLVLSFCLTMCHSKTLLQSGNGRALREEVFQWPIKHDPMLASLYDLKFKHVVELAKIQVLLFYEQPKKLVEQCLEASLKERQCIVPRVPAPYVVMHIAN